MNTTHTMQAIITKFLGPTNTRGARIKAAAMRGSLTVSYDHSMDSEGNHVAAAKALKEKFQFEDPAAHRAHSFWIQPTVTGTLPDGTYAHVYLAS